MPGWLPTNTTPKGRLVLAALELFGERGFDRVGVGELAETASTTTGPLYHHFGTKLGLYQLVRHDVEQRVADRIHGALEGGAALPRALLVGFDYTRRAGFLRLVGEPEPEPAASPIEELLISLVGDPLAPMLAAAWRRALVAAADGTPVHDVRAAIESLVVAPGDRHARGWPATRVGERPNDSTKAHE